MKHIQKIVKIACILKDKYKYTDDEVYKFIMDIATYTNEMRALNEGIVLPEGIISKDRLLEKRNNLEKEIKAFLLSEYQNNQLHISHSPLECPIRLDLGKEYANYEDNKSFVIDL